MFEELKDKFDKVFSMMQESEEKKEHILTYTARVNAGESHKESLVKDAIKKELMTTSISDVIDRMIKIPGNTGMACSAEYFFDNIHISEDYTVNGVGAFNMVETKDNKLIFVGGSTGDDAIYFDAHRKPYIKSAEVKIDRNKNEYSFSAEIVVYM